MAQHARDSGSISGGGGGGGGGTWCLTFLPVTLFKKEKENVRWTVVSQYSLPFCLNLNDLPVTRQIYNTSPGGVPRGKLVPGSSMISELGHTVIRHFSKGIRESGRSLQSLIVCGKKLFLYASLLAGGIWNVAPEYKKGEKYDAANYRPVSLTCIYCKTLQHIIASNIDKHLSLENILADCQHGFRSQRLARPSWFNSFTTW